GSPAVLDPGKARDTAKDLLAQVRLGRDPAVEKKQARVRAAETMGIVLPRYLARQRDRLRRKSFIKATLYLENYAQSLHAFPVAAIDRRVISTLLLEIDDKRGPRSSNQVRSYLCAFFAWAVREGLTSVNEAAYTNKAVENGPRERVLVD